MQAENRVYADQNKAQKVEIDTLKTHVRGLEDNWFVRKKSWRSPSSRPSWTAINWRGDEKEHSELVEQYRIVARDAKMPPTLGRQLQELSRVIRAALDPETGLSKLDTDILFDSGDAELKPGAERMLAELGRVLRGPRPTA